LASFAPDVILAHGASSVVALMQALVINLKTAKEAWTDRSRHPARPRRRGDRVKWRFHAPTLPVPTGWRQMRTCIAAT
jgi:hypothetical protein